MLPFALSKIFSATFARPAICYNAEYALTNCPNLAIGPTRDDTGETPSRDSQAMKTFPRKTIAFFMAFIMETLCDGEPRAERQKIREYYGNLGDVEATRIINRVLAETATIIENGESET